MTTKTFTREAILIEAKSWLGTPYVPRGRVKGAGVDCATFLAEVFSRVGLVKPPEMLLATYPIEWHLHRSEELYLRELLQWADPLPDDVRPLPADVLTFKIGRTVSHGSLVLNDTQFIHSWKQSSGVTVATWGPYWEEHFFGAFRLRGLED